MAHEPTTEPEYVSSAEDFREHEETYRAFLSFTKWSIIGLAVLVVFLYIVIRP